MPLVKLVCNVDDGLLEQVDAYAATLHITRTAAVSVLLSRALQAEKLASDLSEMMDVYRAEKEKNFLDDKIMKG